MHSEPTRQNATGHDLAGRVCIVTGAGRGIGAAIARAFFAAGAKVLLTDVDATSVQEAARAIATAPGNVLAMQHDVTDEQAWKAVVDTATAEFGGVDVLVNNAGLHFNKPLADISIADFRRLLSVNLEGVFLGTREVVPAMRASLSRRTGTASIINLSSVAGLVGTIGGSAYCMTKGGVRLFTKSTALELAPERIRVNSIHPGLIETDMGVGIIMRGTDQKANFDERKAAVSALYPLQRIGTPEDIANAAVFLAGEQSSFMTGSEFVVDGGHSAR